MHLLELEIDEGAHHILGKKKSPSQHNYPYKVGKRAVSDDSIRAVRRFLVMKKPLDHDQRSYGKSSGKDGGKIKPHKLQRCADAEAEVTETSDKSYCIGNRACAEEYPRKGHENKCHCPSRPFHKRGIGRKSDSE